MTFVTAQRWAESEDIQTSIRRQLKYMSYGRRQRLSLVTLLISSFLLLAGTMFAQETTPAPLTLPQAVSIALEKNPLRKAGLADTQAASADVKIARSALIPHLTFSETATRGNDPVYVFGTRLRQQRFTAADFALNRLNTPLPLDNFSTRFGGTWNLFDSMASWRRLTQAVRMQEAATHQLDRTDQEIVFRVIDAYYNVLLAAKQLDVAEQSLMNAQAILESTKARYESGVALESDYLSAQVRASSRQQELIRAQNNLALAKVQLNVALGLSSDAAYQPVEALAEKALTLPTAPEAEKDALSTRPDLKRIQSEESAQKLAVEIAKSSFGPRVNAFASWQLENPTLFAGGGGNNWVGGIELQFDLFTGGQKKAQLTREQAVAEKVAALKQAAMDGVRLEVRRAYYDADAAQQQVPVAHGALAQAQESFRVNQNRYSSGLATITDLLGVEESLRRAETDYWEAVYRFHTSYANLELATGMLNANSPVVKP